MVNATIEDAGRRPVHFLVVEFPEGTPPFNAEMAAELMRLHDVGLIRVLDLVVIVKDTDGAVRGCEATGLAGPDLRRLGSDLPRVLSRDDVARLAQALEPGTTAGVVVWDDTWAAPFVTAARRTGGAPVAAGPVGWSDPAREPRGLRPEDAAASSPAGSRTWEPMSAQRQRPGVLLGAVARWEDAPRRRTGRSPSQRPDEVPGDHRT